VTQATELARPTSTGAEAQRQLAQMKARLIARYKLVAVPGRSEELVKPGTKLGVSLGYGCKTIRVRAMRGRVWLDDLTVDYQIQEGWGAGLYGQLDQFLGFVSPATIPHPMDSFSTTIER
jgi:hypothetical protein